MKKLTGSLLLVVLLFPVLLATVRAESIIAFGDSITDGLDVEESYPSRLAKMFAFRVSVQNEGIPGFQTGQGVGRIGRVVRAFQPDTVLILLGSNDVVVDLPMDQAASNVINIARQTWSLGATPIVGTVPPITGARAPRDRLVRELNSRLVARANGLGIPVADVYSALEPDLDLLMEADGLHPNDAGLAVIASVFMGKLGLLPSGRSYPVFDPRLGATLYEQTTGWFWGDQFGVVYDLADSGWLHSSYFEHMFPAGDGGWVWTTRTGWTVFTEPTDGGAFWSSRLNAWTWQFPSGVIYTREWGDLYPIDEQRYLSPSMGRVYLGEGGGWLYSDKFGWIFASLEAPGKRYFSTTFGWLARSDQNPRAFWSYNLGEWIF